MSSPSSSGTVAILRTMWRNLPAANLYFLRTLVFPELMRFQEEKISASGGDLGGSLIFPKRIGFTGTQQAIVNKHTMQPLTHSAMQQRCHHS